MECLDNDEMMQKILNYISSKPNFFTSDNEITNVKSCLRNSMSWVRKVANFPAQEAKRIYNYYNDDNKKLNCLDTSMGFGSRMSGALLSGNNYFGFEPNNTLYEQLVSYKNWLLNNNYISQDTICNFYNCGSETYQPDLENSIDVSFTSPPYFNLEKYANDNSASTKNYNDYSKWVEEFVIPTVENTYKYLKINGYAMINVKNLTKSNPCYDDFFKAFSNITGFEFIENLDLSIIKKQYGKQWDNKKGVISNKEPIMVFRKVK